MDNKEKLMRRIDKNFADYKAKLLKLDSQSIFEKSEEIAAYTQAHRYLKEQHSFEPGELEYLLLFQNPLEVVAEHYRSEWQDVSTALENVVMNICDKRDDLADYLLIKKRGDLER